MPRKRIPQPCGCGCGEMTKGGKFVQGHDAKVYRAILQTIGGDVLDLKVLVERATGAQVVVNHNE